MIRDSGNHREAVVDRITAIDEELERKHCPDRKPGK